MAVHVRLELPGLLHHLEQLPVHDEGQAALEVHPNLMVRELARQLLLRADAVDGGQPAVVETAGSAPPLVHRPRAVVGAAVLRGVGHLRRNVRGGVVPDRVLLDRRSGRSGGDSPSLGLSPLGLLDRDIDQLGHGRERVGHGDLHLFLEVVVRGHRDVLLELTYGVKDREGQDGGGVREDQRRVEQDGRFGGGLAGGQAAAAEARLAEDAAVAAQVARDVVAGLDLADRLPLRLHVRRLHAADHRVALRQRELLDDAAHHHAAAQLEAQGLCLGAAAEKVALVVSRRPGAHVPGQARILVGEAPGGDGGRGRRSDDVHGRRDHRVGLAGDRPADLDDNQVVDLKLVSGELHVVLEAAGGLGDRQVVRRATLALLLQVLRGDQVQDLAVDLVVVDVALHIGIVHRDELVGLQLEVVLLLLVNVRDSPRHGLRAALLDRQRDVGHQEEAGGHRQGGLPV
mmetsp:Transcript_65977/g.193469  ORF Transcript_65977/g.193469 Transcript_65977/m.193469 type:complete len:457 (-) Transcript_65977:9-1379(-)